MFPSIEDVYSYGTSMREIISAVDGSSGDESRLTSVREAIILQLAFAISDPISPCPLPSKPSSAASPRYLNQVHPSCARHLRRHHFHPVMDSPLHELRELV